MTVQNFANAAISDGNSRLRGDTIISIPRPPALQPLVHDPGDLPDGPEIRESRFKIRLANNDGRRSTASYLIQRRYAWRGYQTAPLTATTADRITLAAFDNELPVATITVGIDSKTGLAIEGVYKADVTRLRAERRLCEFTKLAVDRLVRSQAVLAAIFHIAYIYAHVLRGCTDVLIEVNPRHVRFYESMLGFTRESEEHFDERVGAPAVLMRLDFALAESEIARLGGHRELARTVRSLYPLFFSPVEEQGIVRRLAALE